MDLVFLPPSRPGRNPDDAPRQNDNMTGGILNYISYEITNINMALGQCAAVEAAAHARKVAASECWAVAASLPSSLVPLRLPSLLPKNIREANSSIRNMEEQHPTNNLRESPRAAGAVREGPHTK